MPFLLDGNPTTSEMSDAINYMLSNFSTSYSADPNTGQVTGPDGTIQAYLYKYMAVKYADSFDGTVNFSNLPTNRSYYGLRNNNFAAESSNPADYIWNLATGGFGVTKFLWFICTGGRQIQFAVATSAPDTGWLIDPGASIDLDVVTSGNIPVIAETFFSYFTPATLQVPRTGNPLSPVFTNVRPAMFSTDGGVVVPFTDAQTDSSVAFIANSWRIGNSSTTGNGDISYTNITIGAPTDAGDYALWPVPTAMSASPAYITVPVRYKNSLGVVTQASVAITQLVFSDPGAAGLDGPSIDISGYTGFVQNPAGAYTPTNATLTAVTNNVTSPTYAWAISGGTPSSATTASVVVTPFSSSTGVTVTLTVNGSNLLSPASKTVILPVIYDGVRGVAGANGVMSAFPTIFQWTGSSTPPTRPSTTSTYTWATGAYTAPAGWDTTAPSNTTPGNYLWSITVPLNEVATVLTSTLDWTNVANPIRGIAYNGANGSSAATMTLSATGQSFTYNGNGAATPGSQTITFTANPQNLTGTTVFVATKYNSAGASIGSPSLGGSGNTRTLAIADFDPAAYCRVSANLSGYQDDITVVRLQDGTSTVVGVLTNEAVTVAADSSGTVASFANAGGNFIVYQGITDVTSSSTFSVASSSGVTISINSGGAYTVSAMSALQGTATLRAVYNSITIDRIYNISKSLGGVTGSPGSATYVIARPTPGSLGGPPTPTEVYNLLGRYAVAGDICTVSFNNYNNAEVYQYITAWALFTTYITGSLIVQNTITADKLSVSQLSAINANLGTITAGDVSIGTNPAISGTTMTGTGAHIYSDGQMVVGNASKNINWNNSALTVNGDIISTGNIVNDAVTTTSQYFFSNLAINDYTVTVNFTAAYAGTYIANIVAVPIGGVSGVVLSTQLYWNTLNLATESYGISSVNTGPPPMAASFQASMTAGSNSFQARLQLYNGWPTSGTRGGVFFITLLKRYK
jgi:hypothetical protein